MRALVRCFACFALALVATSASADLVPGWLRLDVPSTGVYAYRYVPTTLSEGEEAPVVVFLHGSGSNPEAWRTIVAPHAEALGFVALLPKSVSSLGFGPGEDDRTILDALEVVGDELAVDPDRVSIGGHSSGGAYALVLAHGEPLRFAGALGLGIPYRVVVGAADPDYAVPTRLVYGSEDPNYFGGSYAAWREQLLRLGAPLDEVILPGVGHGSYPAEALAASFAFLVDQVYPPPPPPPPPRNGPGPRASTRSAGRR